MIKISIKAINDHCEEVDARFKSFGLEGIVNFLSEIEEKARKEKPVLFDFILDIAESEILEGGSIFQYKRGAYCTSEIIKNQLKLNQEKSSEIIVDDKDKVIHNFINICNLEVGNVYLAKLGFIEKENKNFSEFIKLMTRDALLGALYSYSIYEQAFKRLKIYQ